MNRSDPLPLLVTDIEPGYEEMDYYDGPVAFFTRAVPGAPEGLYYASMCDQLRDQGRRSLSLGRGRFPLHLLRTVP